MTTDHSGFPADLPTRLTEAELARHWHISPRTLQRWRQTASGPCFFKINGRILYARNDVLEFELAHRFRGAVS